MAEMTVVEFRRKRRGGAGREGTRMHGAGAIEDNPGFADGRLGSRRDNGSGRPEVLDPETAARAEALAARIQEHREAFACSQQEFAEESGISRATLSKIEQGHIYPSIRVRKKLAKALGVGPQELWNARRPEGLTNRIEESKKQAS